MAGRPVTRPPRLGEHTREVPRKLDSSEMASLKLYAQGVSNSRNLFLAILRRIRRLIQPVPV